MKIAELLATILTITGFYLISEQQFLVGFCLSLTANVLWMIWATSVDARGIFVVNACLAFSAMNGILGAI